MNEQLQAAATWAKSHPILAGGLVLGAVGIGYLASRKGGELLDTAIPGLEEGGGGGGEDPFEESPFTVFPNEAVYPSSGIDFGGASGDATPGGFLANTPLERVLQVLVPKPDPLQAAKRTTGAPPPTNPAGGVIGGPAYAAHDTRLVGSDSIGAVVRSTLSGITTAGPQPRPVTHGYSAMPASTTAAFATGQAERIYAAPSRVPKPRPVEPSRTYLLSQAGR